jgi:hypothetical protein
MGFLTKLLGTGSPKLTKQRKLSDKKSSDPSLYEENIPNTFNLGWHYSEKKNQYQMAKISNDDRNSHFYVIGSTGVGKTKFLEYMILQDFCQGRGVGVIDPHGDLIEDIKVLLAWKYKEAGLEEQLAEKVILIDPTDPVYTVTFNPLEKLPGVSAAEQANELVSSFKKIWADSWGVRMEDLMRNSLIALSEAELTLVELSPFLSNRSFREIVLEKVKNPIAKEYFQRFNVLTDRGQITWIEPIMNKINAVFCDDRIKQIFSAPKSTFNFREAMDQGKVLLIKLDKGRLKDSADLLGSLLMAKIQMAAFSRSDIEPKKRVPFYLYIDEFQNFASDSFALILSEARKYGLYITMVHQSLSQISSDLRDLILSCAGIQVYFRLGRQDAQTLAKEAFEYSGKWENSISELQNLSPRICYIKNKIQGGITHMNAVPIEPASELLKMDERLCQAYINDLPFGFNYLIDRETLIKLSEEMRSLINKEVWSKNQKEKIAKSPVPVEIKRSSKPEKEPEHEVIEEKVEIKETLKESPVSEEKGTTQHKYLQNLIKRMAEEKGYRAVIEQPTPDGLGRVDVGLERNGKTIACEFSVTTNSEHELSNIEKCLKAGYDKVIMCSSEKRSLEKIRTLVMEKLADSGIEKVMFFEPEELLFYLESEAAREISAEQRVKGYKVNVQYEPESRSDKSAKRDTVAQILVGAMRRMKGKS